MFSQNPGTGTLRGGALQLFLYSGVGNRTQKEKTRLQITGGVPRRHDSLVSIMSLS